ncbi:MAG TPA: hypothetical protein VI122_01645 [Thermoleophilaceae bacterium]
MKLLAEVAFVVVAAVGAAACLAALAVRLPAGRPVFESGLRPRVRTDLWPAQLVRLERIVEWSGSSGLDAHTRLRPVLVEIAEVRLAGRGLRLERDVAEARRLLGPKAWELVRPDRPAPRDRDAPGIAAGDLEEILDALEAL